MMRYLLWLVLLLPSFNATAGLEWGQACYQTQTEVVVAFNSQFPSIVAGHQYEIASASFSGTNGLIYALNDTNLSTGVVTRTPAITITFMNCTVNSLLNYAAVSAPVVVGSGADACLNSGNCTSSNVVSSNEITQDVIVYCAAALLFFLGFHVGNGIMMGSLRRQG